MGIAQPVFDDILSTVRTEFPDKSPSVAIMGDCTFHTTWRTGDNRADLLRFASEIGAGRIETIDVYGAPTIKHDLHQPIPAELVGQFDLVIDAGTLYCCFDISAVWRNYLALLNPDGLIYHQAAMIGYMGRGYYNLHPMLFRDFYAQNGFDILAIKSLVRRGFEKRTVWQKIFTRMMGLRPVPQQMAKDDIYLAAATPYTVSFETAEPDDRVRMMPADVDILCVAKRRECVPFAPAMPLFFAQ